MTAQPLTPRDVADMLRVSERTVYRMMADGTLPYWAPTPRKRFVSSAVLERLMDAPAQEQVA